MWLCIYIDEYVHIGETAYLIVKNSAQTSFRFSPISFCAPQLSLAECHYALRHFAECRGALKNVGTSSSVLIRSDVTAYTGRNVAIDI